MTNAVRQRIQWHPPFYTALQVELDEENLVFQDEYCVRKLPCRMDVLVTKQDEKQKISKNIGQIFRKYNLVEYKPPGDYLSIDDYFYMQGNASLLKSGGQKAGTLPVGDISVKCVCYGYPRKLMRFLQQERHLEIVERFPGIYHIRGEVFPTQIVVTRLLYPADNLWLSSLRKSLEPEQQDSIVCEYERHKDDRRYEELTSFVASINIEEFRRRKDMCKGLMEVVRPEIEEEKRRAIEEIKPQIVEEARPQIVEEARLQIVEEARPQIVEEARPQIVEEARPQIVEEARPWIVEEARPAILLEAARGLLDCLDVNTIAQKLGLPVEMVRRLEQR